MKREIARILRQVDWYFANNEIGELKGGENDSLWKCINYFAGDEVGKHWLYCDFSPLLIGGLEIMAKKQK